MYVHTDLPIVTKDICWSINQNPKHAHFVVQCLYYLHCILRRNELWSKIWCLNWVLPHAEPEYWHTIAKWQYFGRLSVTRMICLNKKLRQHEVASCNWHIPWYRLLGASIKLCPVTLLETVFGDGRIFWVKTQLPLWMRLQISKDIEFLIEVPESGHCKVA